MKIKWILCLLSIGLLMISLSPTVRYSNMTVINGLAIVIVSLFLLWKNKDKKR